GHRSRSGQRDLCGHRQAPAEATSGHERVEAAGVSRTRTNALMETPDERIARQNYRRHGGTDRWHWYEKVEATIVSGGGFFARRPPQRNSRDCLLVAAM